MSYTVTKTNGELFAVIPDGTLNTESSMFIVGKNYAGYGEFISENFIHLLENSANDISPQEPLAGQLWFDTKVSALKVFNGDVFRSLGSIVASNDEPQDPVIGDLWYDSFNKQLFVYTGEEFLLIGPAFTPGLGVSGAIVDVITDILGEQHTVIKFYTDDELVGIVSNDLEFVPENSITGFSSVMPGFQLRLVGTDPNNAEQPKFEGTARSAFNLVNSTGDHYNIDDVVLKDGSVMTGPLLLNSDPTELDQAATKRYVDNNIGGGGPGGSDPTKVLKTGDTMTGHLTLNADPVDNLHAATKQYTQSVAAENVAIAGDTMTGDLILNGIPTANLQAATKQYVDIVAGGGAGSGNVPTGGTIGQHLAKKSSLNYDTEWVDAGSGGGGEDPTKVPLDGSVAMSGPLTLSGDPTADFHASTKQYTDGRTNSMMGTLNIYSLSNNIYESRDVMQYNSTVAGINGTFSDGRASSTYACHHGYSTVDFKPTADCNAMVNLSFRTKIIGGFIDDTPPIPGRALVPFQFWISGGAYSKSNSLIATSIYFVIGSSFPADFSQYFFLYSTGTRLEFLKDTNYTLYFEDWLSTDPAGGTAWNNDRPTWVELDAGVQIQAIDESSKYSLTAYTDTPVQS